MNNYYSQLFKISHTTTSQILMNVKQGYTGVMNMLNATTLLGAMSALAWMDLVEMVSFVKVNIIHNSLRLLFSYIFTSICFPVHMSP